MTSLGQQVPMLNWLGAYRKAWVRWDVVAGLTAAAVVIPQAMAYGAIASLPLVAGLYTALVPLLVYAVMGTSQPLSVTTTSTLAILTAGAWWTGTNRAWWSLIAARYRTSNTPRLNG